MSDPAALIYIKDFITESSDLDLFISKEKFKNLTICL